MGNLCCGEDDFVTGKKETLSGAPPPRKVMTPDEDQRREQARAAAEERLRKDSVRGTQRYQYVVKSDIWIFISRVTFEMTFC